MGPTSFNRRCSFVAFSLAGGPLGLLECLLSSFSFCGSGTSGNLVDATVAAAAVAEAMMAAISSFVGFVERGVGVIGILVLVEGETLRNPGKIGVEIPRGLIESVPVSCSPKRIRLRGRSSVAGSGGVTSKVGFVSSFSSCSKFGKG